MTKRDGFDLKFNPLEILIKSARVIGGQQFHHP